MKTVSRYRGPHVSTWLVGHIDVAYQRLVDVFGEPGPGDGHKTDAEWKLKTPAGVATIYNYKDGPSYQGVAGLPVVAIRDWHIGGTTADVIGWIEAALAEAPDESAWGLRTLERRRGG